MIPSTKALHSAIVIGLNPETGNITVFDDNRARVLGGEPQTPTDFSGNIPRVAKPSFLRALMAMFLVQTYRLLLSGVTCDQFSHVAYSRLPCHHACGWSWRVFMVSKILLTSISSKISLLAYLSLDFYSSARKERKRGWVFWRSRIKIQRARVQVPLWLLSWSCFSEDQLLGHAFK